MRNKHNNDLLKLFQTGLQAVHGTQCVADFFTHHPFSSRQYSLVAIGKAAPAMALGAITGLSAERHSGLVITKQGHLPARLNRQRNLVCLESAHPIPDGTSLAAGQAMLDFLAGLPADLPVIFLISGGASALVEVLADGVSLDDLQRANDWLLASGLAIEQMNVVRKSLSMIKAGRLARLTGQRPVLNLLLSDVPGNDPAVIGSGLLVPDQIPESMDHKLLDVLPDWLVELISKNTPAPKPADPVFRQIETHLVGDNRLACEAICQQASEWGYQARIQTEPLAGEVSMMAKRIFDQLQQSEAGLYIWGGETTVTLPPEPGRGGRNQHLALALALAIKNRPEYHILVAGTDGSDGAGEDASGEDATIDTGAIVDGETVARGEQEGLSAESSLAAADSGRFLEFSGDLLNTGPTGTNVMDLLIAIKE